MSNQADIASAERISNKRARMFPVLAILLIAQQGAYLSLDHPVSRTADQVKLGAFLFMSLALLLAFWTGGALFRNARVRALLNDEGGRARRDQACRAAFLAMMLGCLALYVLFQIKPFSGMEAVHIIMTIGLSAALLGFGVLERRAGLDA